MTIGSLNGNPKVDGLATLGLAGISNSLAYRVHEIERHLHSYESWLEEAGTPSGTHKADRIGTAGGAGVFRIDAGNSSVTATWGAWVQLLGSADTPIIAGSTHYDFHRLMIAATERNNIYFIQIGFGASGADAISNGDYTEAVLLPLSNQIDSGPIVVQTRRQAVDTLAWARCLCPGQDTATLDFFFALHEYEG